MTQRDQLSQKTGVKKTSPKYGAQVTLQYKTFIKRTMVEALQNAFSLYDDETLERTKIGPNYQTTSVDFPNIVVKFYEQRLQNAGVSHREYGNVHALESLKGKGFLDAAKGEITQLPITSLFYPGSTKVKAIGIPKGTYVTEVVSNSAIKLSQRPTTTGLEEIVFEDVWVPKFFEYHHFLYHGDIALEIYGKTSTDRDKISDAIIEVINMGVVGEEGETFQNRLYHTQADAEFPYSSWHFPVVNTDLMQGYGETAGLASWMPEDVLVYKAEYRVPVMGEFYSITPETTEGALTLLERVDLYPWTPEDSTTPAPDEFPEGIIPPEDYIPVTHLHPQGEPKPYEGGEQWVFTAETKHPVSVSVALGATLTPVLK